MAIQKQVTKKKVAMKKPTAFRATSVPVKAAEKSLPTAKVVNKKAAPKRASYTKSQGGVFVPQNVLTPVPSSKLRDGFLKARKEISKFVEELVETMTEEYTISEIELSASFNADGKFMGFGIGGAATITIRIAPKN